MKKILTVGLILAAVLSLGLMGCKSDPDKEVLSGKWVKTTTFNDDLPTVFSVSGNKVTFEKANTGDLDINTNSMWWWHPILTTNTFTGVRVKMTCSTTYPGHGLLFVDPDNNNHYYRFSLRNKYVLLEEYTYDPTTGKATTQDLVFDKGDGITYYWGDFKSSINPEPQENEVVFYTAKDGSIKLLVNDTLITSIASPSIKSFYIAVLGQIAYQDKLANNTVTATYNFVRFQTSK